MKILKYLICLLILFLSIGLVSATEIDLNNEEGISDEIKNVNGNVTGNTFQSLQTAINDAGENGELILTENITYEGNYNSGDGININKNGLTIDGNGFTINGDGKSTIFRISGNNVILKNLNIINGKGINEITSFNKYKAGAIYNTGNNLTIINSNFSNNNAVDVGGAISNVANDLTIINSTFSNNVANKMGGAIYNKGSLDLINISFINNSVSLNDIRDNVFIDGITDERARINIIENFRGGAIYNEGTLNILNNTFYNNKVFVNVEFTIYRQLATKFESSISTTSDGGAIYNSRGEINIKDSSFSNNLAYNRVYNHLNATAINSGEAISYAQSSATGGALYTTGGRIVIENSEFNNNLAHSDAYAYSEASTLAFLQEKSEANSDGTSNGGAIIIWGGSTTITNSIFNNNSVEAKSDALSIGRTSNSTNKIQSMGGGAINNQGNLSVVSSIFTNNKALQGGALVSGGNMNVTYSIFTGNSNNVVNIYLNARNTFLSSNYWGVNVPDFTKIISGSYVLNNYYQLLLTINHNPSIKIGDNLVYHINLFLNGTTSSSNVDKFPDFNVTIKHITNQGNISVGEFNAKDTSDKTTTFQEPFVDSFYILGVFYPTNIELTRDTKTYLSVTGFNANDIVMVYLDGTRYVVTLVDSQGKGIPNKTIILTINGRDYTRVTDINGRNSSALNLAPGNYNLSAKFLGDSSYAPSSISNSLEVKSTIIGNDITKYYKNGTQYHATIKDGDGNPVANTPVQMNINGVFYTRNTDKNGIVTLSINLDPGKYIITVTNPDNGQEYSNQITVLSTIEGKDITKIYQNGTQYYATILDGAGNPIKNRLITMNINGVMYERSTNANGTVMLTINLNPETYIITVYHPDNGQTYSNTIIVLPTLLGLDVTMFASVRKSYDILLVDDGGNPLSGKTIEININGIFYYKDTDSNGIARLMINLDPGSYIATAIYDGYSTSNSVIVNP